MYYIEKKFEISASHSLILDYESKCTSLHGHNWIITVYCKSSILNKNGMVVDFSEIKENISKKMDHKNLNEVFSFNTTAENIAFWICNEIKNCYKVKVQESDGNIAIYEI